MRNTLTLVFAAAALVVSGVCLYQARELQARKTELARLEQEMQVQAKELEAVQTAQDRLKRQRLDLTDKLEATSTALESAQGRAALAASNAAATAASTKASAGGGKGMQGLGGTIAKMLENPEMKKMIAQQQRTMVDTMFGPLFNELGLSKEDTDRFKELLLAQQMKGVEQAGALFGEKSGSKDKAELTKAMGDLNKQSEEEIKAFLGDERYTQYKDYKETVGERMQLSQFSQQLANSQTPLTPDQQSQLIGIMKEERKVLATDFASLGWSGGQPRDPQDALSEEKMNQIMDLQQNLGQRVFERAKFVLQPEQLDAFGTFQTNQLSMQRLGIKMFQGMMGDNKQSADGAAPPSP